MKLFKTTNFLALISLISFSSCKKDDVESPTISISEPTEHTTYNGGDTIHVEAHFTDNEALASYTMEVGDEAGDHIHDFHFDDAGTTTESHYDYHTVITVPDSLSESMFYLHFSVTDAAGNVADKKWMLHFAQ